jgi:hypothetical protein
MKLRHFLPALLLPLLAAACQSAAVQPQATKAEAAPDLRFQYQALARNGAVYVLDPAMSKVLIHVFRAGAAARLGHNHVLSAPKFEGYVSVPSPQAADARFDLSVAWADLLIDEPLLRSETGDSFRGERSAEDIEGTRRNMLGDRGMQADQFPLVRLHSVAIEGDWPILIAQVEVTLHGVTRTQPVLLRVERGSAQLKISGSMTLRQSDFGISPFSALGGLMKVQDVVAITFALSARSANF